MVEYGTFLIKAYTCNIKKPGRIRVVFDCSSQHRGVSLNSILLSGPDLTNSLLGVLLRFRQEQVAVVSDVECMFYQVKVAPEDRDCLRFFWWPGGNINLEPVLYRMTVHLFGATSSPSCANYALHQTVEDNREYFDPSICQAVERNFSVLRAIRRGSCAADTRDQLSVFTRRIPFDQMDVEQTTCA